jgi:hypothetical protein
LFLSLLSTSFTFFSRPIVLRYGQNARISQRVTFPQASRRRFTYLHQGDENDEQRWWTARVAVRIVFAVAFVGQHFDGDGVHHSLEERWTFEEQVEIVFGGDFTVTLVDGTLKAARSFAAHLKNEDERFDFSFRWQYKK